jgi:hypothetical protein
MEFKQTQRLVYPCATLSRHYSARTGMPFHYWRKRQAVFLSARGMFRLFVLKDLETTGSQKNAQKRACPTSI